jgi:deferrochelatase/peroxidase EfeB
VTEDTEQTDDGPSSAEENPSPHGRISRRGLLGLAGAGVVGAGIGLGVDHFALPHDSAAGSGAAASYPFYGEHQSGITTAAQDRLHFASYDVADIDRSELIGLLKDWTAAAERMTRGLSVGDGATGTSLEAPPDDTGEALDLPAAGLTITFGFGPGLFTSNDGTDRFGIASKRPEALIDLPAFGNEVLQDAFVGGDLCIQACSDDPQVAVHAIRNLSRIAFGRASIRWSQLGFGRTSSTSRSQVTARNLFGFKDGTANVKSEDTSEVDEHVWVPTGDSAPWMTGGSYLVARKIRMIIETWDRTSLGEQERIFGRDKGEGAPLSGGTEFTEPNFAKKHADGTPDIALTAHVRLAHPKQNDGAVILRRGYNYVDGNDDLGRLNAGLFFLAFQRDPRTQFVRIQNALSKNDAMNEYTRHIGSAIFAVPPGARTGSYVGAPLFEA